MPSYNSETIDFGSLEAQPNLTECETDVDNNCNDRVSYASEVEDSYSRLLPGTGKSIEQDIEKDSKSGLGDVTSTEAKCWKLARILGYISLILLSVLGLFCFVESFRSDSSSVFAFAFSCLLDSISAGVVIWRSYSTDSPEKSRLRELQAELLIGTLFWIAAMFILVRAMIYLNEIDGEKEATTVVLYVVLGIGCGLQIFFFFTKTPLAFIVRSPALVADGLNSLAASILAAAGILVNLAGERWPSLAIADDIVGVVVSICIASYGTFLLYQVWIDHNSSAVFDSIVRPFVGRQATEEEKGEKQRLLPSNDKSILA